MKRRTLSAGMSLLLASCSDSHAGDVGVPGTLVIDRIEQLAARQCVGTLDRWERHFYYALAFASQDGVRVDHNRIGFSFIEASRPPYRPRRVLSEPDLDEASPGGPLGEYHVASGRLFLLTCGDETGRLSRSRVEAFIRWQHTP